MLDRVAGAPGANGVNLETLERRIEFDKNVGDLLRAFAAQHAPNRAKMPGQFGLGKVGLGLVEEAMDAGADGGVVRLCCIGIERERLDPRRQRRTRDKIGPLRRNDFHARDPFPDSAAAC